MSRTHSAPPAPNPSASPPARVAVITGAGSGIGRAVALALARSGWSLALIGRRPDALRGTAGLTGRPRDALLCPADVSRPVEVEAAFRRIDERFDRIDLLVNNAGVPGPTGRIDRVPPHEFSRTLEVNVTGQWLCAAAAFRRMASQAPTGGRIITNGSIAARVPRAHASAYAVSKHATTGITRSLALDGRPLGITATQLDIGNASTGLLAEFTARPRGNGTAGEEAPAAGDAPPEPTFDVAHVARMVAAVADLPATTSVPELVITATGMPYDGRG